MSKAEEATNDFCTRCFKYGKCHKVQSECTMADSYQEGYEDGYHQAENDNELTWENMMLLEDILEEMLGENMNDKIPKEWGLKEYYQEVLKRFKERR